MVIDRLRASKDFDGREKTVNPFTGFWCVICVRRNRLRNLNYNMVKLILNTGEWIFFVTKAMNTVISFLTLRVFSLKKWALVFKYFYLPKLILVLFSSLAESQEIQTLQIEQFRTVEKITLSFMQNPRLQQTGGTSFWYIQRLQVKWSVSILFWSLIKLTFTDCYEKLSKLSPRTFYRTF